VKKYEPKKPECNLFSVFFGSFYLLPADLRYGLIFNISFLVIVSFLTQPEPIEKVKVYSGEKLISKKFIVLRKGKRNLLFTRKVLTLQLVTTRFYDGDRLPADSSVSNSQKLRNDKGGV